MGIQGTTDHWAAMLQPASLFTGIVQNNIRAFWIAQTHALDEMQVFAEGWFERRHTGTRAALEACECMCAAKTPNEFLAAYQKWLVGAGERAVADGMACQSEMRRLTGALAPSLVPSAEHEDAKSEHDASRKRMRATVS